MSEEGRVDPYRVLFERLDAGAARFRFSRSASGTRIEVLDENAAFGAVRSVVRLLDDSLVRACETGTATTVTVRGQTGTFSVAMLPTGPDEVMIVVSDLSEQEALTKRSQASQSRFEQAFRGNAAAMVIAQQSDLRIVDVNPRWLELFGATREQVIGKSAVELGLISVDDAARRIAQHREFVNGYDTELELRTLAGERITVLASAKPILIDAGPCTLTTLIDITARKHAEEAFAVAFRASPAGMLLVDAESDQVVAVNQRLLEMTGFANDDLVGKRISTLAFVKAPDRAELLAQLGRVGRLEAEVQIETKDGAGLWTLISAELIRLQDKVHRLSVFTDIRARKLYERRLLCQHAIGAILAGTSEIDPALPRVIEVLGQSEGWDAGAAWILDGNGELRGRGAWHRGSDPRARAAVASAAEVQPVMLRVLATGIPEAFTLETEGAMAAAGLRSGLFMPLLGGAEVLGVMVLAGAREPRPLDAAKLSLLDSLGRVLGLFVERARAEASLRELNAELERRVEQRTQALETSNRELEAFSSTVSHDLRAPLRTIAGFSSILIEDFAAELPAEARRLLGSIRESGDRLRNLIDDLLAFSRLGRGALRRRRLEVEPLVRSVLEELLAGRDLGDRIALRVHPLGTCDADASLLRAVWTNLLDNALKYARDRPVIEIEIGAEERSGQVVYYVRDNGVGFDMAEADRLFGVFQRLHAVSDFEGTGLGLANVRRIIERHHGWIHAQAEVGRGARFEFALGPDPG